MKDMMSLSELSCISVTEQAIKDIDVWFIKQMCEITLPIANE